MHPKLKAALFAVFTGVTAGLTAAIFIQTLNLAGLARVQVPELTYGLPLAGLLIGWVYHRYGVEIAPETGLILDQIHEPKKTLPPRMVPLIYVATSLTQLVGGSAGREGAIVQSSASLSDQLSRFFKFDPEERRVLLVSGIGAGFGAALGTPWAGVFFGMEMIRMKRFRFFALFECLIASWVGFGVTHLLRVPHMVFPAVLDFSFNLSTIFCTLALSITLAVLSFLFISLTHSIERLQSRFVKIPFLRPFLGGSILLIIFKLFPLEAFQGLGLDTILQSFRAPLPATTSLIKLALTAITIGSGFKGGEFIPLFFMGTSAGNLLSQMSHSLPVLLPALGGVALFGAAAKTPFSCSILAVELFGWPIAPLAFLTCYLSFFLSGKHTIYRRSTHAF